MATRVLHGAWVHAAGVYPSRFALWGEESLPLPRPSGMPGAMGSPRGGPPALRVALTPADTQTAVASLYPALDSGAIEPWPFLIGPASLDAIAPDEQASRLSGAGARAWSGTGAIAVGIERRSAAAARRVDALTFDAARAVPLLTALGTAPGGGEGGRANRPDPEVVIG